MRLPFLNPLEKDLPLSFSLAMKRVYLDTHLKEELTDLFENCQGVPYSCRQINDNMDKEDNEHFCNCQYYTHTLEIDLYLPFPKKAFLPPFNLAKKRTCLGSHFRATSVFPIPRGRIARRWLTLC